MRAALRLQLATSHLFRATTLVLRACQTRNRISSLLIARHSQIQACAAAICVGFAVIRSLWFVARVFQLDETTTAFLPAAGPVCPTMAVTI